MFRYDQISDNQVTPLSQVVVSEPQFPDDPVSVASLSVSRSPLGEGTVHLAWFLEKEGWEDLTPHNGTITFNEVDDNALHFSHTVQLATLLT